MNVDVYYCQNGSLRVYGLGDVFQLSVQQLRILMEVYRAGDRDRSPCARPRLHSSALNHRTLPPGPAPHDSQRSGCAALTSSRRAALSRSLRRLHERGLIGRSRSSITRTSAGTAFTARLFALPVWRQWCRDWLPAPKNSNSAVNDRSPAGETENEKR